MNKQCIFCNLFLKALKEIMSLYICCVREASNERWHNVITPASYWEGTAGHFYFRLPSGKESMHLPVVKTQPPNSYSLCLCWKDKRPHDEILHSRKPWWEYYSVLTVNPNKSIKMILMKTWQSSKQRIPGCWMNNQVGDKTSAVVSTGNECDQTCLN